MCSFLVVLRAKIYNNYTLFIWNLYIMTIYNIR
ncbi:hypothetical protein AFE_2236 [Acidithiobacillus ferrooxidans ATCC 23270]|uniref:Uncharacterized protein n=1 Tax=Acidithiobacillus ferrooxidans (strain ATCC 23270 / DSM 14882 / CIP 104768 / NCIMB 8455) TaxID=243159 RepID=B7J5M3_ACIF2|nr:hypothetical protein AFE_2236 [Acidithiobacillus ferrooxidans ATCC 23270]